MATNRQPKPILRFRVVKIYAMVLNPDHEPEAFLGWVLQRVDPLLRRFASCRVEDHLQGFVAIEHPEAIMKGIE